MIKVLTGHVNVNGKAWILRYTGRMRPIFCILIPAVAFAAGCPPRSHQPPGTPWWTTVELDTGSVEVPYEAVTVREVARHEPPDGVTWPSALDFRGQTMWVWEDVGPILFSGTAGSSGVFYAGDEEDGHEDAGYYRWETATGSIEWTAFDPQPPDNVWPPIPYYPDQSDVDAGRCMPGAHFYFVGVGGRSSIESVTVNGGEPQGQPIVDSLVEYTQESQITTWVEPAFNELSVSDIVLSANPTMCMSLAFSSYRRYEIPLPARSVTRLVRIVRIQRFFCTYTATDCSFAIRHTHGAELTGFTTFPGPDRYFFLGESPFDSKEYTFIAGDHYTDDNILAIGPVHHPDAPGGETESLRITGRIPAVEWQDRWILFAEWGEETPAGRPIVAIRANLADLANCDPTIIWASTLPDFIDGVKIVVPVGSERRPYIVFLDPTSGNLTVFDPLLGSIRYQGIIELGTGVSMTEYAAFCVNFDPDPARPTVFIHDPNANEIIQLEIETREPDETSSGGRIIPIEDVPPDD